MRSRLIRLATLGAITGFAACSSGALGVTLASAATAQPTTSGGVSACASRPKTALLDSALTFSSKRVSKPKPAASRSASAHPSTTSTSPAARVTKATSAPAKTSTTSASAHPSSTSSSPSDPPKSPKPSSPDPSASSSHSASSSPKPSASSSKSASPKPSSSATSPKSPTPHTSPPKSSPAPTKTPTKTASPSPSPSKSSSPAKPQLCVLVQPFVSSAQVHPGQTASFAIWVWSATKVSDSVTVQVQIRKLEHAYAPRFTVCRAASGSSCSVGPLPAAQSDELEASVPIGSHAAVGGRVDLTATATAADAHYGDASGTITLVAAASATPSPTSSTSAGVPVTLPPVSVGGNDTGIGTGVTPTDPAGLFPTVSPGPGSSSPGGLGLPPATKPHAHVRAVTASATVPLDSRLIGGQLAGLAVLAGAIVIAIARLSLRTPRPQDGPGKSK